MLKKSITFIALLLVFVLIITGCGKKQEEEPMDPYTMARNFLHLKGGTKGDFTAEQFAQSIVYWNNHAMTAGKPKWRRILSNILNWIKSSIRAGAEANAYINNQMNL